MFQAQNIETINSIKKLLCPSRSLWRRALQDRVSQNTRTAKPRPRPFFGLRRSDLTDRPTTDGLKPHHCHIYPIDQRIFDDLDRLVQMAPIYSMDLLTCARTVWRRTRKLGTVTNVLEGCFYGVHHANPKVTPHTPTVWTTATKFSSYAWKGACSWGSAMNPMKGDGVWVPPKFWVTK